MQIVPSSPDEYIAQLPEDKRVAMEKLRKTLVKNLPKGFAETLDYSMISYVVPHSLYPKGYHCNPKQALPFISIAARKNFLALYHMGIYLSPDLLEWFAAEYPNHSKTKLDMGKSCIRFKKLDQIPYDLIAQLAKKMTVKNWINLYEIEVQR